MKRNQQPRLPAFVGGFTASGSAEAERSKMWEETEPDTGVDDLLAVLGYKVKASDMADVAQKLEQLEQVMVRDDRLSQIASDSVHFNPSDISSWLESMIYELNHPTFQFSSTPPPPPFDGALGQTPQLRPHENPNSGGSFEEDDYDLKAIPGKSIIYPQIKRPKPFPAAAASPPSPSSAVEPTRPVILADSQELGVRLVHTLMACAEAVQLENFSLAGTLVKQIGVLAASQPGGAMQKIATYFAEGLARRIYRLSPSAENRLSAGALSDLLETHFYETCPYLKFAHFTTNQQILEAFADKTEVHVIDFGMKQGMQWPALMQALALRPGGPPKFRLTGIGPPSSDNTDYLQEVGWKLAQLADTIHVQFNYRGFVANSLADINASMLDLRETEAVAVNSVFELHQLLARPGSIEKVLSAIRDMKPEIFTVVEQEANHNGPVFFERFTEALHYYSTLFDSLEGCSGGGGGLASAVSEHDRVMSEIYLGRQICNVVACEGVDRVERHETLAQWRIRFGSAGFEPVHLGSNAYKQASMLLALFNGGQGYVVEEDGGCLMLGWHTRSLIATSAWRLSE